MCQGTVLLKTQMNFLLLASTGSAVRQPVEQKNASLIPFSFISMPMLVCLGSRRVGETKSINLCA